MHDCPNVPHWTLANPATVSQKDENAPNRLTFARKAVQRTERSSALSRCDCTALRKFAQVRFFTIRNSGPIDDSAIGTELIECRKPLQRCDDARPRRHFRYPSAPFLHWMTDKTVETSAPTYTPATVQTFAKVAKSEITRPRFHDADAPSSGPCSSETMPHECPAMMAGRNHPV